MNDQFGGYDLSFGLDSFAPPQVQQQQVQQPQHGYLNGNGNNNGLNGISNGPCMDNYDPNRVLIQGNHSHHVSPYNSMTALGGRQHSPNSSSSNMRNGNNGAYPRETQNHNHQPTNTHQLLIPAGRQRPTRRERGSASSQSSSHGRSHIQNQQQQQHSAQRQPRIQQQHHLQTGFSDFEPIPIPKPSSDGRGRVQQQQLKSSSRSSNSSNGLSVNHRQSTQVTYQRQQQQQSYRVNGRNSRSTESVATDLFSLSSHPPPLQQPQPPPKNPYKQQLRQQPRPKPKPKKEEWLENLKIPVPGVSLDPMTGTQILLRLKERSEEVLTRYLPCVDFLVQCQQELRKGLQVATTKRYVHHMFRDTLTPREFHSQYIAQLPDRFFRKNKRLMTSSNLTAAYKELQTLVANAKGAQTQGCEVVKNTFLGGMKDGESWGLRKWLSKHGGALHICNDTECLSTSCQKLDRELETTRKLAERLRPLASAALKKLKSDIPSSYQEQSSAHPYLPFFHRLECALRGMSNFDPEDDDVICIIDDDEVEELKAKAKAAPPPNKTRKRSRNAKNTNTATTTTTTTTKKKKRTSSIEDDSDIEILDLKPAAKRKATKSPVAHAHATADTTNRNTTILDEEVNDFGLTVETVDTGDDADIMQELLKTLDEDNNDDTINFDAFDQKSVMDENEIGGSDMQTFSAFDLANGLELLASLFDTNQHDKVRPSFIKKENLWDEGWPYASALRLLSEILRSPDCASAYIESVDEDELIQEGKLPYTEIVRHPLCFRDICSALFMDFNQDENSIEGGNGVLPFGRTLNDWNMWNGKELLQAIDLVFLNSLAYGKANGGGAKCTLRSKTNKLRKVLWSGIKEVVDASIGEDGSTEERRKCTPTRRGESSGFVVHKASTT